MEGNITCITATCGRHTLMERSLRFFLNQRYENVNSATLLIFNNSVVPQRLTDSNEFRYELGATKFVKVVNQHKDTLTGKPYRNLGAIYNDALKHVDDSAEVIIHWDDDDIFLPDHISEGMKGLKKAIDQMKLAYKPKQSYFRHPNGQSLMENVLEPSIFVKAGHIRMYGYSLETTAQHLQWVQPLVDQGMILSDPDGKPTLIYNWGDTDIPTFKTSGNPGHTNNFDNYRNFSQDHGNQILTPWSKDRVEQYYK
jgi:hypothetical protein